MAVIAVVAKDEAKRGELKLALEELGHLVAAAKDLPAAMEVISTQRPRLVLVAQEPSETVAESALAELEREAPLLPVVVAMTERKAGRAMELLKAGAYEVVAPPWTADHLSAITAKALRFKGTAFEASRPVEKRIGVGVYAALGALLILLAGGWGALERHRRLAREAEVPAAPTEYALPYAHPAGLAFDGKQFWISDWFSQTVHRHDASTLAVLRTRHLPQERPGALAFAGDSLYAAAAPRGIVRHMLDDRLTVLSWTRDKSPQTVGIAYDGLYLWTVDTKTKKIHKRIPDEGLSVIESFVYPGERPTALTFDGRTIWSLDWGNREMLRHDLANPERVTMRLPLNRYRGGEWKPTGLAFDGKRFLTTAEQLPRGEAPGRVFVHEIPPDHLRAILAP
jgi:CheY-like chemotaxis protein